MYYKIAVTDSKRDDQEIVSNSFKTLGGMMEAFTALDRTYDNRYDISVGLYLDGKLVDSFDYKRN